jgi:biotin carboxylase
VALGVDLNGAAIAAALGDPVAPSAVAPAAKVGGACVRFLVAKPGDLRRVSGVEEAAELPGIRGIRLYRRPGHRFGPFRRGGDRAGAILAVGESRDDALAKAARAAGMVKLETAKPARATSGV